MNMLIPSDLENYNLTGVYEAAIEESKVYIRVLVEYKYFYTQEWLTIGRYDIENKEGKIILEGFKEYKWYKGLKALWNAIYKVNSNACITSFDSIQAKIKAIKPVKQVEKEKSFIVGNKNFNTMEDAKQYCDMVDFDYSMITA